MVRKLIVVAFAAALLGGCNNEGGDASGQVVKPSDIKKMNEDMAKSDSVKPPAPPSDQAPGAGGPR